MVPPLGIEPKFPAPQAGALTTKLRRHKMTKGEYFFPLDRLFSDRTRDTCKEAIQVIAPSDMVSILDALCVTALVTCFFLSHIPDEDDRAGVFVQYLKTLDKVLAASPTIEDGDCVEARDGADPS
jgi:hypothetical protein